jgi:hypothetical protein
VTQPPGPRPTARPIVVALLIDAALVLVFAGIGRASHGEDVFGGLLLTAWPFLAGLALGWLVAQAWRAPFDPWRTGLPVWAITVAGGMLLRGVSGQGAQLAFIIVAASVLLVFLVGWRLIARLVSKRRPRP